MNLMELLVEVALQEAFESLSVPGFVALAMQSPLRGAAEVVLLQTPVKSMLLSYNKVTSFMHLPVIFLTSFKHVSYRF